MDRLGMTRPGKMNERWRYCLVWLASDNQRLHPVPETFPTTVLLRALPEFVCSSLAAELIGIDFL